MIYNTAEFRFYAELNDFLPQAQRQGAFLYQFRGTPTVKAGIEALGVPHPEVDVVLVNGHSVGFEQRLDDGDRVAVYPRREVCDVSPVTRLRPDPLRPPRFVLDTHLGRLCKRLRLLGFDAAYRHDYDDAELIRLGREEERVVLTRDRALLKHKEVTRGYWVRAVRPREQVREVLARFHLYAQIRAFMRCTVCNGAVEQVAKAAIQERLEPLTRAHYDEFVRCKVCGRLYWKGSHYQRMQEEITLLHESNSERNDPNNTPPSHAHELVTGAYFTMLEALVTALTQESDRTVLLTRIMQHAVESIEAAGAGDIFVWDETTQCLIPRAWHNLGDWILTVRLRLGEGVAGTAAQRRETVLVNDYANSPYVSRHFTRRLTHTAVMAAPMLYRGRLLGAITVGNEGTGQRFTPEHEQQLGLFAALAALAIVLTEAVGPQTLDSSPPSPGAP